MSNSGWESYPEGIEMCRYDKRSLGYGARIRVDGVTAEIPYEAHIAICNLAATAEALAEHQRVLDEAEKALKGLRRFYNARAVGQSPEYVAATDALAAIAKLKGKQG